MATPLTLADLEKMFKCQIPIEWIGVNNPPGWNVTEVMGAVLPPKQIITNIYLLPEGERTPTIAGLKMCTACKKSPDECGQPLLLCGRCKVHKYCSKACQVNDWKGHKQLCAVNRKAYLDVRVLDNLRHLLNLGEKHKHARENNDPNYMPFFWTRERWDALREVHWFFTKNNLSHHRASGIRTNFKSFIQMAAVLNNQANGPSPNPGKTIWQNICHDDAYLAAEQAKYYGHANLCDISVHHPSDDQTAAFDVRDTSFSNLNPEVDGVD